MLLVDWSVLKVGYFVPTNVSKVPLVDFLLFLDAKYLL